MISVYSDRELNSNDNVNLVPMLPPELNLKENSAHQSYLFKKMLDKGFTVKQAVDSIDNVYDVKTYGIKDMVTSILNYDKTVQYWDYSGLNKYKISHNDCVAVRFRGREQHKALYIKKDDYNPDMVDKWVFVESNAEEEKSVRATMPITFFKDIKEKCK